MKKIFYTLLIISLILIIIGCDKNSNNNPKEVSENPPDFIKNDKDKREIDPIESLIDDMTLEEKIGQLLIFGFKGKKIDSHIADFIKEYKISGLILFNRNIGSKEETKELIQGLKTANEENKIPLFISIDEEGGRVSRLKNIFENIPSAEIIGKTDNIEETFEYGKEIGSRLLDLGINLNYAPVLDINTNPNNPVIGDRAFGNTPNSVIKHGIGFMKGLQEMEIISCVKHFPGHGDTHIDSHIGLPVVNKTLEELKELELLPFIKSIEEDVDMVMVSHILYPEIDKEYPASLSKKVIEDVLREDLKFTGVVITDDLTMGGISENYEIEDGVVNFLKAGGDIALIAHNEEKYIDIIEALKKAIDTKVLTIDDIDKKLYRILSLKEKSFYNLKGD